MYIFMNKIYVFQNKTNKKMWHCFILLPISFMLGLREDVWALISVLYSFFCNMLFWFKYEPL